jgi:DNA-binding NtrC family response regulator
MFNKSRRSREGRSGGRRPFRAPRSVEIDKSRRLQGSDFRPAKRVARERELCSVLAASERGLPTILITGRNDLATQRLIAKVQVVASLFKPVDEGALFDAIARALALSDG